MLAILMFCAVVVLSSALPEDHFYSAKFEDYPRPPTVTPRELSVRPFRPKLNHFRPQDDRRGEFTYTLNTEHYQGDGPIFIFINDAGRFTTEWITGGLIYDVAREFHGALATSHHRYFGDNRPTPTASFEDLAYLTVDQALADIASLIATVKADLGAIRPHVVVWGTGYGGTLAALARKKYPHLVNGVFASSGLFRAESIDNVFYDNLSAIIRYSGSTVCADRIGNAFDVLENLIENAQIAYLQERLRLCEPLDVNNHQEVAVLIYEFIDLISNYIHLHHLNGLQNLCNDMNFYEADTLNSLIRWVEHVYGGPNPDCVNINYDYIINALSQTEWDSQIEATAIERRLWTYMRCTQIGALRVSSGFVLDIFPADLITAEYQRQFCQDVLGPNYDPEALDSAIIELNSNFGAQDQVITHVIFSNAALDPLIHHGISEYDRFESGVVFLSYNAAGGDLGSISAADSVDLYNAKLTIEDFVHRWILNDPR